MKNFKNYTPKKYATSDFQKIEEGIYKTKSRYSVGDEEVFVTSLTFEMEPDCYGEEDASPRNLTQVPIEGLLDEFNLFVTDFYEQLNETSETICYQEFGSFDLADIQKLSADSWGNSVEIPVFANDSIGQFIDCLGIWLSFYQQLRDEVDKNLAINPKFSLFDHKEMYEPILNKLKEIDPESVKWRKYFWRRMCEPDIL